MRFLGRGEHWFQPMFSVSCEDQTTTTIVVVPIGRGMTKPNVPAPGTPNFHVFMGNTSFGTWLMSSGPLMYRLSSPRGIEYEQLSNALWPKLRVVLSAEKWNP